MNSGVLSHVLRHFSPPRKTYCLPSKPALENGVRIGHVHFTPTQATILSAHGRRISLT